MIKTFKFIFDFLKQDLRLHDLRESPWWYITMHVPYLAICIVQAFYVRPFYKNRRSERRVYDGISRNGIKKGNVMMFLHSLGCIKQYSWKDDDGRGYFIGYSDDDLT